MVRIEGYERTDWKCFEGKPDAEEWFDMGVGCVFDGSAKTAALYEVAGESDVRAAKAAVEKGNRAKAELLRVEPADLYNKVKVNL